MSNKPEKTNVDYSETRLAQQGPDNPYDDALAFKSLLGAVHGEFNKVVNDNIVSGSESLRKVDGKQILQKGVMELMGRQKPNNQIPAVIDNPNHNQPNLPPEQPQPQHVAQQIPIQDPPQQVENIVDKNQLEFNFDNSATAQKIFDKIESIEIMLNELSKKIDSLQKIPAKRTYNKKK